MQRLVKALRNGADYVAAAMLAAMFAVFIAQITARYLLNLPMGWSVEVCLTLWLWLVLWGSAFCLSDNEHVKFDLLYQSVSNRTRRIFSALSALAIIVGLAVQLPAAWDYVDFYKIKRSATLLIPLKWVFIIFIAFSVGLILRYAFGLVAILRDRPRADRSSTP